MKKFPLLALSMASLLPFSFTHGQAVPLAIPPVKLELVSSATGLPTETVTPLNTIFTLNIAVQDTTGTQVLAGFDLTLASLPTGLTFDGFSDLTSNFTANAAPDGALSYSATSNGPAFNITIGLTPITLLQATFTATNTLALGPYTLDFIAPGLAQGLDDPTGDRIPYQDILDTLIVAPEPGAENLLFLGLAAVIGFGLRRRIVNS
jgi:hypothetical protein